ncbi:MAG: VanZ family protein [Microbacterium sp.]|uniref:VanZ family protein n=1 Tax=Microbacterium sp. TaxID=51671 RepID=UPI001AC4C914|nr:VanZ family protein [Microbacterium sp.]MBN9176784.1 VanZ family protein [Microbacterium sp.]
MGNEVYSAAVAIGLGVLVGTALFVPFVAVSYRRRGRLTLGRFLLWAAALVYFLAIWTYTLLPLPDADAYRCAGVNLDVLAFVDDLRSAHGPTDVAVMQLALNVLLFLPLGFFLRVLGGRGILVAFVTGLGVSLVIETTQLTGVWGLYPCAYRVFDVDDLLTNTVGAVLGSVLALVVPRRLRGSEVMDAAALPHPVTRGRRLLAMVCDGLGTLLVSGAVGIGAQVVLEYVVRDHAAVVDGTLAQVAANVVPIAIWGVMVLATGRTVGDAAVELRYRGGPVPQPLARPLRFVGGIGGYLLLSLVPGGWAALSWVFAAASLIATFATRQGRGLPGLLSGQDVVDARAGAGEGARPQEPAAK